MSTRSVADDHYKGRQRLVGNLAAYAKRLWAQVDAARLDGSWEPLLARLVTALAAAQASAAGVADEYLDAVLAEQALTPGADGTVRARALTGVAADGRDLLSLLRQPVIATKAAIGAGAPTGRAMATGYATLDMIVRTEVADAGRVADQIATAARPAAEGYTRLAVGKTCSRCIVLAGRWYQWNAGFDRHPRCDCVHVPGSRATNDVRSNPRAHFDSLSEAEQDRTFTKAGAQAIREGADIGRVVNARRGMYTAGGRSFTREATTRRGIGRTDRLMPEQIFRDAGGDRAEAVRLLQAHGYLIRAPRPAFLPSRPARIPAPRVLAPPAIRPPARAVPSVRVEGADRLDEVTRDAHLLYTHKGSTQWDGSLGAIAQRQRFDALPRVGTRVEVDEAVGEGWTEVWRGVGSGAARINQDLRYGQFQPGHGLYGNGVYTSTRRDTAEAFRGVNIRKRTPESELEPDSMLRIAIDPRARIVDYDDLLKEYKAYVRSLPNRGKLTVDELLFRATPETGSRKLLGGDIGRYAAARGYDAVRIPGGSKWVDGSYNYRQGETRADQYNIINRSVMLIQEAGPT